MEKVSLSSSKVATAAVIEAVVKNHFKRSELEYLQFDGSHVFDEIRILHLVTIKFVNSSKMVADVYLVRNVDKRSWELFEMKSQLKFIQSSLGVRFGLDPQTGLLITEEIS